MSESVLSQISSAFISVKPSATLLDVLKDENEQGTDDSWFVVFSTGESSYGVIPFGSARQAVKEGGARILNSPISDLTELVLPVESIDQDAPLEDGIALASKHDQGVVVVTWSGDTVVGILHAKGEKQVKSTPSKKPDKPQVEHTEQARSGGDPNLSVSGDVHGDVQVAGRDIITNVTEIHEDDTLYDSGPEWLRNTMNWMRSNVILSLIGFGIFILFPMIWFIAFVVVPTFQPKYMSSDWNVAVASFTPVDNSVSRREVTEISNSFFERLESEMNQLESETELFSEVWSPSQTGGISGDTREERAENAEARALQIGANILIYGTIEKQGDTLVVQPEFYVNAQTFSEVEELVGYHSFGDNITISDVAPGRIGLNRQLSRRSEAMSLITSGLSLYFTHFYDDAYQYFIRANSDEYWPSNEGREVIYLFIGNAAIRSGLTEEATEAFNQTILLAPEYGRGYAGLASAYYDDAISGPLCNVFEVDSELIDRSIETYGLVLTSEIQPPTADLPTKTAIGLGQNYLIQWLVLDMDTRDQAEEQFELVISLYEEENNPRTKDFAAEAYARLGFIARRDGDLEAARSNYLKATELTTDPGRKALFWSSLANIYLEADDQENFTLYNDRAISDFQLARTLTTNSITLADLWFRQAERKFIAGDTPGALTDLGQAINLIPVEHPCFSAYHERRGELALETGDAESALRDYETSATSAPTTEKQAELYLTLITLHRDTGDTESALSTAFTAIRSLPVDSTAVPIWLEVASLLAEGEDTAGAEAASRLVDLLNEADPNTPAPIWGDIAEDYIAFGFEGKAEELTDLITEE